MQSLRICVLKITPRVFGLYSSPHSSGDLWIILPSLEPESSGNWGGKNVFNIDSDLLFCIKMYTCRLFSAKLEIIFFYLLL